MCTYVVERLLFAFYSGTTILVIGIAYPEKYVQLLKIMLIQKCVHNIVRRSISKRSRIHGLLYPALLCLAPDLWHNMHWAPLG